MPNAAQHAAIGGVAAGGTYLVMCRYYRRQPRLGEFVICGGAGVLATGLPDLLEPAAHPHHRQFAHSLVVGGLLAKFALEECGASNKDWGEFPKIFLAVLIVAYISHLIADGFTPRGLPLLGQWNLNLFDARMVSRHDSVERGAMKGVVLYGTE